MNLFEAHNQMHYVEYEDAQAARDLQLSIARLALYPEQREGYIPKNMGQLKLTSFIFDQLQEVNTVWRIARDAQDWQTVQKVEEHEQKLYRDLDSWDAIDRDWSYL